MRRIYEWIEHRRARRRRELYERGFKYAMSAYFLDGHPLDYIEDRSTCTDDWSPFDTGALAACRMIERLDKTGEWQGGLTLSRDHA